MQSWPWAQGRVFLFLSVQNIAHLGSRFDDKSRQDEVDRRARGNVFAEKAHKLLDLRIVDIATIQACVLLGTICFVEGQVESEVVFYAAANRISALLDLPNRPADDEIAKQVNLRGRSNSAPGDAWY
jgi:hypothetical protein